MNNPSIPLSEHFTLAEMTKTSVKKPNVPTVAQVMNLKRLCLWLERLRGKCGTPIVINSGFRSLEVNRAVGGAARSNHLKGCAADIRCSGIEQAIRYAFHLLDISETSGEDFDELLIEHNRCGSWWVHFAVRPEVNRRKVNIIRD